MSSGQPLVLLSSRYIFPKHPSIHCHQGRFNCLPGHRGFPLLQFFIVGGRLGRSQSGHRTCCCQRRFNCLLGSHGDHHLLVFSSESAAVPIAPGDAPTAFWVAAGVAQQLSLPHNSTSSLSAPGEVNMTGLESSHHPLHHLFHCLLSQGASSRPLLPGTSGLPQGSPPSTGGLNKQTSIPGCWGCPGCSQSSHRVPPFIVAWGRLPGYQGLTTFPLLHHVEIFPCQLFLRGGGGWLEVSGPLSSLSSPRYGGNCLGWEGF